MDRFLHSKAAWLVLSFWITITLSISPSEQTGSLWHLVDRVHIGVTEGVVVFFAVCVLVKMASTSPVLPSYGKHLAALSLILGAAQTLGANYGSFSTFRNPGLSASANLVDMLFRLIGWSCAVFIACTLLLTVILKLKERGASEGVMTPLGKSFMSRRFPLVAFLVCLLCWLPYLIILFPGVATFDTFDQINQGLGYTALKDHHPFMHTVIQGQLIGLGRTLFGSIYSGIVVATVVQMILLSAICALCVSTFGDVKARIAGLAFFALHPVIAWYSVTLWKDVLYSGFILLFALSLYKVCAGEERRSGLRWFGLLFIAALGTLLLKKSGVMIVVPAAVVALFFMRRDRLRLMGSCCAALAVFFVIQTIAISCFGVIPGQGHEAYSLPLQQIARTVKFHAGEIDDETAAQVAAVLPYEELGELYNPVLSDPVKGAFDDDAFAEDPASLFGAYFKLGFAYPNEYLNAFLSGTYGYWYPEVKYWMVVTSDYLDLLNASAANSNQVHDEDIGSYVELSSRDVKSHLLTMLNSLRSLPIVSCFFSIGFWVWVYCFLFVIALRNKMRAAYPVFLVAGLVWVVCLMSPLYAEMRYAFALLLMLPLVSWAVLGGLRPGQTAVQESEGVRGPSLAEGTQ